MFRSFTCLSIGLLSLTISAQDCSTNTYVDPLFAVEVEHDVLYGTAERFDGGTAELRMDIHRPIGDGGNERPLLVAIHGGAFMSGDRSDMSEVCNWYAARGYVAATVSYRLGFRPPEALPNPYAYDEAEVLRASYRAQQDVKGAIRFLRARHALDNSSTENVFVYGVSAGGITGMHVAYATNEAERPVASGAIGPVEYLAQQFPRPDLGPVEGSLNLGEYDATVKACVSYFGALLDTALIGSIDDPALFTYHQTGDPIVGCGHQQALWGAPLGIGTNYPWLFGSCAIDPRMQHLGFTADRYEFHPYEGTAHDIHDIPLVDGWAAAFLARQFCGPTAAVAGTSLPTQLNIFPNPANDRITVSGALEQPLFLRLMDLHGRPVRSVLGARMALAGVAEGIYLLEVESHGTRRVERVVIAR